MEYLIEYYYVSHRGRVRSTNQDNYCCLGGYMSSENNGSVGVVSGTVKNTDEPAFAVFDGMGGEECGEIAAYIAAGTMAGFKFEGDPSLDLIRLCKTANAAICKYTDENDISSMGTTAAILKFTKKKIWLCNIGDSKIFRFSGEKLQQISYDHVSVSAFGTKPPLTQNLGIKEDELIISPYTASREYNKDDVYLICSDGLTDMVTVDDIAEILKNSDRESAASMLLEKALENGGRDNTTIVLLYVSKDKRGFIGKLMDSFNK